MLLGNDEYDADLDTVISAQKDWSKLDGNSVLVVGASGLIGSFLVDVLMRRNTNIQVYAMGRSKGHLIERFAGYQKNCNFHMVVGDVVSPLPEDIKADYIIHAASNTHPRQYATDPIGTITTNLVGTERVLQLAVKVNAKRVIFMSSVEIYGENRGDVERFDEQYTGQLNPNTLRAGYPEGKRVSESLCQAYIAKYGVDVVIPRVCRTFGPTMKINDSKASSQFILNAVRNDDIVLKSEGNQYYSYAYVGDVVSALLFLMTDGKKGEAYNIANPAFDLHLKELAEKLARYSGGKVVYKLPDAVESVGFSTATTALLDSTKLNALGWHSQFDLEIALEHTVSILRNQSR